MIDIQPAPETDKPQKPCAVCGNNGPAEPMERSAKSWLQEGANYRYLRCRECGLVYLEPQPDDEELARHYRDDYEEYAPAIADLRNPWQRLGRRYGLRKRCGFVCRFKGEGRLLDVGCATGIFLDGLRQFGNWQVRGVEFSGYAADYARRRFGLEVSVGRLAEAGFSDESFDVVTMWNVIEHLTEPRMVAREVHRLLTVGGLFVVATPDPASLDARVFGRHWVGYDAPRHLYLYSPQTMTRLFVEAGFRPRAKSCFYGSQHALVANVRAWAGTLKHASSKGGFPGAIPFVSFARLTAPFYAPVAHRLGLGPLVTYVWEKK